jgi:hypothetical protein
VVAFGGGVLAVGQGLRASSSHSRPTAGSLSGDHVVSLHGLDDEAIGVEGRELRPFLWPSRCREHDNGHRRPGSPLPQEPDEIHAVDRRQCEMAGSRS